MIRYHFGAENKNLPAISFGAESDLRTERIITDLFDEYGLASPQYLPDNIFLGELNRQPAKTNFIAVGLFGNRLTAWMGNNNYLTQTLEILPVEKCIKLLGKTYYAKRDTGVDYALFCKITVNSGSAVFIIGGIEGFGTQRIGEYFADNWLTIYEQTAGHENFTLLFEAGVGMKIIEKVL
jgi:hypothetical protein